MRRLGSNLLHDYCHCERPIEQAMNEQVLMMATLTVYGGAEEHKVTTYTGYAHEKKVSGKDVNATSHIENCETSARGRALLAAGFGTGSASAEEMMKVDRYEKADAAKKQKPDTPKPAQEPKAEVAPSEQPTYRQMCVDVMATEAFKDIGMQQYGSMRGGLCTPNFQSDTASRKEQRWTSLCGMTCSCVSKR